MKRRTILKTVGTGGIVTGISEYPSESAQFENEPYDDTVQVVEVAMDYEQPEIADGINTFLHIENHPIYSLGDGRLSIRDSVLGNPVEKVDPRSVDILMSVGIGGMSTSAADTVRRNKADDTLITTDKTSVAPFSFNSHLQPVRIAILAEPVQQPEITIRRGSGGDIEIVGEHDETLSPNSRTMVDFSPVELPVKYDRVVEDRPGQQAPVTEESTAIVTATPTLRVKNRGAYALSV